MKVLHVIDKSFIGGGQAIVRDLVEGLGSLGLELRVACRPGGPLVAAVERLGVTVHSIPFDKRFRPGPALAIARLVAAHQIDLVHGHGLVATSYAALARATTGMRAALLYHQHGFHHHNYGRLTQGLRKSAERWVVRTVDVTVASNMADRDVLERERYAPGARLVVLPNGIPELASSDDDHAAVRAAIRDDGRPVVGLVGRLHRQKAVDVFLRAAVGVIAAHPAARVVVVGEGPLAGELSAMADTLSLRAPSFTFAGALPGRACAPRFDVAVLCSRWEGLPITLLEYMAARRPIVSTALSPCEEVLGADAAEMVPVDDPAALAAAINRLLADPVLAERRAAAARLRYEKHFTLSAVARRYRDLYEHIVERSSGRVRG